MDTPVNAALHILPVKAPKMRGLVQHLAAVMLRCVRRFRRAAHHQALGADELRAMSDLALKDLGIGRSEIAYALREGRTSASGR